jgi:HK97 family phage prohead protease
MKLDPLTHVRAFDLDAVESFEPKSGRLLGRVVPYNTTAHVLDRLPNGTVDIYVEGFRPGAFDRQVRAAATERGAARRIHIAHAHEGGLGYLGHGTALVDKPEGLWADFQILRSQRGNVEDLLGDGIEALSIEYRAYPNGTDIDGDGVRWRTAAHLDAVALEPVGAYTDARVLAYRAEIDELAAADVAEAAASEAARAAEAEAAARAAAEQAADEAAEAERRRRLDDVAAWADQARQQQAELEARYLASR